MTTVNLAAIENALAAYEAGVTKWPNDKMMQQIALRDLVAEITPDALAALVAVAKAAKALEPKHFKDHDLGGAPMCTGCEAFWDDTWTVENPVIHAEGCPVAAFLDALKAIE